MLHTSALTCTQTSGEWCLLGSGIVIPNGTLSCEGVYPVTSHVSFPRLFTNNMFAVCFQHAQGDASDYHSRSHCKTHQSKANRSWDIWHLREAQAAQLTPAPGPPWCQEGPPSSGGFRAWELQIQAHFSKHCSSSSCMPLTSHPCCGFGTHEGCRLLLLSV